MTEKSRCDDALPRDPDCEGELVVQDDGHVLCPRHQAIREQWVVATETARGTMPTARPPPLPEPDVDEPGYSDREWTDLPESMFEPGVYRHYRGDNYYAQSLGWFRDGEQRVRVVIYMSTVTCEFFALPWSDRGRDSWTDAVRPDGQPRRSSTRRVPRFHFVGRELSYPKVKINV